MHLIYLSVKIGIIGQFYVTHMYEYLKQFFLFQPEVDVLLSVNEPLVDNSQTNAGNLMTITVESLFSPPESWSVTGAQYAYAAALPVPINAEVQSKSFTTIYKYLYYIIRINPFEIIF